MHLHRRTHVATSERGTLGQEQVAGSFRVQDQHRAIRDMQDHDVLARLGTYRNFCAGRPSGAQLHRVSKLAFGESGR
ncbi:hypothetical protein D9M69_519690 [compost metagenome]